MSSDPRDYYRSSRSDLPPLRDVVGDALDPPLRSPYRFDFEDVNRALPGSSKSHMGYSSPGGYYPPERGPTLPPIRDFSAIDHGRRSENSPARYKPRYDRFRDAPEPTSVYTYSASTSPQPATGPATYSFNVLRAQQGDLVDVRTPSSRAQGILRPTAIIEDEDDSHKRYKCDWPGCEKKYDRPSSLEVHRHTHTGSQPYPCQYPGCNRAFNVKSNMLRHFRSHPQQQSSRSSGGRRIGKGDDGDSDSEGDDDTDKWPETSSSARYFHKASSTLRSSSGQGSSASSSAAPSSSMQYYSSSRRR